MEAIQDKLSFFSELVSCNYAINLTTCDANLNTIKGTEADSHVYDRMLEYSGMKERIIQYIEKSEKYHPVVISDSFDLLWIACFELDGEDVTNIHILGPVYISDYALQSLQDKIDTFDIPLKLRTMMIKKIKQIPVIISSLFFQYAIMLHYCIRGEKIKTHDLQFMTKKNIEQTVPELETDNYDIDKSHTGIWQAEQKFIAMIEKGDLNYQEAYNQIATMSRGVKIKSSTPINQIKYSIITYITLCSRAAIRGGLFSGTAYTLSDYYVQKVEEATSISDLGVISREMFDDYVNRVHKINKLTNVSPLIKNAQDYVETNIEQKIQLVNIANQLGYSEYYLSKKFKEEMGISFNDYVQSQKIEKAKLLLKTTDMTVEDLSMTFDFSSRSHFSTVFKKWTEMTPNQYRKQNKKL